MPSTVPKAKPTNKRGRPAAWPKIRVITERSGNTSFRVDAGKFGGKVRLVKQFKTLDEANAYGEELRSQRAVQREAERFERSTRAVSLANLTDSQRADVLASFRAIEGSKTTLLNAVQFYLKHAAPSQSKTVAEVHAEVIASMKSANRRPRSIDEVQTRISGFIEEHGMRQVASITTYDLEKWIDERCRGLTARTRQHTRRVLHRLFAHAVKRNYRESNPVAAIDKPAAEDTRPEIFKPNEAKKLLQTASIIMPKIVPHLALGLFAGLRFSELKGLTWAHIDLGRKEIHVDSIVAKKRRSRYVKIERCLAAWLAPHKQIKGPVFYSRNAVEAVRKKAKLRWPHNVLRHSFGSYHLAAFEDAPRTAAQLGHAGDTSQLFNHYRALVRRNDAQSYWRIKPSSGDLIQLRRNPVTKR
jgi:site-specific recombinase XerD